MRVNNQELERSRNVVDIGVWENEGGAPDRNNMRDSMHHHYGRRVEADGSWTIYHVFTGIPAAMESRPMIGLGKTDATATMIRLNARNAQRRRTALTSGADHLRGGRS